MLSQISLLPGSSRRKLDAESGIVRMEGVGGAEQKDGGFSCMDRWTKRFCSRSDVAERARDGVKVHGDVMEGELVHVLAVDDSDLERKVVERMFKHLSCRVTTVKNALEALEILGLNQQHSPLPLPLPLSLLSPHISDCSSARPSSPSSPPLSSVSPFPPPAKDCTSSKRDLSAPSKFHLIVTDYCMPGMTGEELLYKIKESATLRNIPVVVMSSENISTRVQRCMEMGAFEFLLKPVQLDDVIRISESLESSRSSPSRTCSHGEMGVGGGVDDSGAVRGVDRWAEEGQMNVDVEGERADSGGGGGGGLGAESPPDISGLEGSTIIPQLLRAATKRQRGVDEEDEGEVRSAIQEDSHCSSGGGRPESTHSMAAATLETVGPNAEATNDSLIISSMRMSLPQQKLSPQKRRRDPVRLLQ